MATPTRPPNPPSIPPSTPPRLRRLLPQPTDPITVREAYDVDRPTPSGRPWITLCMVASLDGSVSIDGSSGGLGNANDLAVLSTLRDLADIVIVGALTARGEGYGPPKRAGLRVGVATNSGDVDLTTPLFTSGAGFVMAPESAEIDDDAVQVVRCGTDRLDVAAAVERLSDIVPGVSLVQAEGGPRFNGALLEADLIDEVALTLSPRLVGGIGARMVVGADETDRRFDLAHLLADDDGFVFSRWTRR